MAAGVVPAHSPLADVAAELYALSLAEFTAARNARDKQALADGDLELARQIRIMAKPSAVAWAINQLVRDPAAELDRFLSLGKSLRAAQSTLDRDAIRDLSAQRRQLLPALAQRALGIAEQLGHRLSEPAARQIEQTLEAALADAAAATAITSGRLLRALSSIGFDPVDLADAVAAPDLAPGYGGAQAPAPSTSGTGDQSDAVEKTKATTSKREREMAKREREKARRELEDAAGRAEEAAAELEALTRRMDMITRRRDALTAKLDALKSTASSLEAELRVLDQEARGLGRQHTESSRGAVQAKRAATRAADRLNELS